MFGWPGAKTKNQCSVETKMGSGTEETGRNRGKKRRLRGKSGYVEEGRRWLTGEAGAKERAMCLFCFCFACMRVCCVCSISMCVNTQVRVNACAHEGPGWLKCFSTLLVEVGSLSPAQGSRVWPRSTVSLLWGLKGRVYLKANRCPLGILTSVSTPAQMWGWTIEGLYVTIPPHIILRSQQTSYRCDLHCFLHHFLLVLFYTFSQAKKDIHFSIRDYFIIKISVNKTRKLFS